MATASALDDEFMQYWLKLTMGQKESLLQVARNFISQTPDEPEELRKRLIREEREKYLRGEGRAFSWEEVKGMARTASRQKI
jgi:hypothetical protein